MLNRERQPPTPALKTRMSGPRWPKPGEILIRFSIKIGGQENFCSIPAGSRLKFFPGFSQKKYGRRMNGFFKKLWSRKSKKWKPQIKSRKTRKSRKSLGRNLIKPLER